MSGYKVVLPPKSESNEVIKGRGLKVFDQSGNEVAGIVDFSLVWHSGGFATLKIEIPVSVVEHEQNKMEEVKADEGKEATTYKDLESGPKYREYGDMS